MLKINVILIVENCFTRNGNRWFHSPVHCFAIVILHRNLFSALIYIDIKMFYNIYHQTLKSDLKTIYMPNYWRSLNSTMKVYNLELVRNNAIRRRCYYINLAYFILFTVNMLFSFINFFHNVDVCIFAKTTALLNYILKEDKCIVFTVSMKFTIILS